MLYKKGSELPLILYAVLTGQEALFSTKSLNILVAHYSFTYKYHHLRVPGRCETLVVLQKEIV